MHQADVSLGRMHEGAELGLPLSKSLAELLSGEMILESTSSEGTKVRVVIPPERTIPTG